MYQGPQFEDPSDDRTTTTVQAIGKPFRMQSQLKYTQASNSKGALPRHDEGDRGLAKVKAKDSRIVVDADSFII
jgi:hypothetical protein